MKRIPDLEKKIGYTFKEHAILERALTHRSWAFEKIPVPDEKKARLLENETLEFVGDSVVGLAVAEELFRKRGDASEGELTLMKHRLVSTEMLARTAEALDLGNYVRIGKGEEKTGGRCKPALLANTLEALIGAVFFDGGYISARTVVRRLMADEFRSVTPQSSLDFKTLLQETLQAEKRDAPVYNLLSSEGPSHKRVFTVEAVWDEGRAVGTGSSIKGAEMEAASKALESLSSRENQ